MLLVRHTPSPLVRVRRAVGPFSTKTLLRFLLRISDAAFFKNMAPCMENVLQSTCFVHIFLKADLDSGLRARTLRCCVTWPAASRWELQLLHLETLRDLGA